MSKSEPPPDPFTEAPCSHLLYKLSRLCAFCGGMILIALVLVSCVSIIGRLFFSAPLNGDFELIQMGSALAVFSFFPWAHIRRGHIRIEFFLARSSPSLRALLDGAADALFCLLSMTMTVYLALGGYSAYLNNEQTAVLALPLWWGFVAPVLSMALLSLVCGYSSYSHFKSGASLFTESLRSTH